MADERSERQTAEDRRRREIVELYEIMIWVNGFGFTLEHLPEFRRRLSRWPQRLEHPLEFRRPPMRPLPSRRRQRGPRTCQLCLICLS